MQRIEPTTKSKSAIFLTPETLERILRVCNYVEGLKVQLTDNENPSLVLGELASILEIPKASKLPEGMDIREIDVCVDGVTKKMKIIASEPYDAGTDEEP